MKKSTFLKILVSPLVALLPGCLLRPVNHHSSDLFPKTACKHSWKNYETDPASCEYEKVFVNPPMCVCEKCKKKIIFFIDEMQARSLGPISNPAPICDSVINSEWVSAKPSLLSIGGAPQATTDASGSHLR